MADKRPNPDQRLAGKYELLDKIGQGGMSTVFKARDTSNNSIVAIKIASRNVINDAHLSRRFELEYALVFPLAHRNLVRVLDFGKYEEQPYLVMEYTDGPSLAQRIADQKTLREHDALSMILPVTDALTYLHGQNIIHRDIKPANILTTTTGQVKLADLGLMKDLGSLSHLTRTNMGLGTLQFASPEQFDDAGTADVRSDIYSLAATLYTALMGEPPFGKGTVLNVVQRKLTHQFDPPILKLPQLRPAVDAAIRMALNSEPEHRPQSMSEFVAYLTGWKKYPTDVRLPGTTPNTTAPPKAAKKAPDERRLSDRYCVAVTGSCRPAIGATDKRWASAVMDISATGLCLQMDRRFEAGMVLEIALTINPDDSAINRLAHVRWIKSTDSNVWLLGCEFVKELSADDLETIFTAKMDRTKVTKKE